MNKLLAALTPACLAAGLHAAPPDQTTPPEPRFNVTAGMEHAAPEKTAPAAADIPEFSPEQLLAQPELLKRALLSSLLLRNPPAVRQLLPIFRRLPDAASDPDNRLLATLSQALLDEHDGHPAQAAAAYRRALQDYPDLPAVRFFLAHNLFADRQNREAEQQVAALETSRLPESVAAQIPRYRQALAERRKWQFHGGLNYTRDNNINGSPRQRTIPFGNGVITLPAPESAQGIAYRAGANRDWYVKNGFSLRTGADVYGKFYWDNHKYDDANARFTFGGVYRNARNEAALLPYFERRWYGTEKYARETGVRAELGRRLNAKHRLFAAAEYGRERHDSRPFYDGPRSNVSASWMWAFSPRGYAVFGADASQKKARDGDDSYRRYALRAAWTQYWQNGLQSSVSLNAAVRRYRGEDLFGIRRRDREYHVNLSFGHEKAAFWGVRPQIVAQWQRNHSNHPRFQYQKANAFIQLNKDF